MDLVIESYRITNNFPKNEIYGLASQLQRAAVSVPANIAEGHSRKYSKEFIHFLSIAKGSLAELETHIQIAGQLSYINERLIDEILDKTTEVGRILNGLRKSIARKSNP